MSRGIQYIGMDVHKEAIVIAVLNDGGKLVMESIIETKASSILQFIHGLRGELHVTWEEGTWAAWLYDLLKPHVHQMLVCDPRRNALLPGSVVNFPIFVRNCPKIRFSPQNICSSRSIFHNLSFSPPGVLIYEFDGVSHSPTFG